MMKCRVRCGAVKKGGCQWVRTIFRGRTGWAAEPVQPWEALNSQFREPSTHAASGQSAVIAGRPFVVHRNDSRRWRSEPTERQSDRKSTRLNSSHGYISYAVFCLKKKNTPPDIASSYA